MNKYVPEQKLLNITYFLLVLSIAVLSTFVNWTPGSESWGYWFFNKEFQETGTFLINERSPLFTIYLSLFSWLNYPTNIILHHMFSSTIAISNQVVGEKSVSLRLNHVLESFFYCPAGGVCHPPLTPPQCGGKILPTFSQNRVQKPKRRLAARRRLGPSKTPSKSNIIGTDTHTEYQ